MAGYGTHRLVRGIESAIPAAAVGAARDAAPISKWLLTGLAGALGVGLEVAGVMTRNELLGELGEGFWIPAVTYAAEDTTELVRQNLAAAASSAGTSTQMVEPINLVQPVVSTRPKATYMFPEAAFEEIA